MGDWERLAKLRPEGPYGFIQWKGTNACIDFHCACGLHAHVDGDFVYSVKCSKCGQEYDVVPWIQLSPTPQGEENENAILLEDTSPRQIMANALGEPDKERR